MPAIQTPQDVGNVVCHLLKEAGKINGGYQVLKGVNLDE